MAVSAHTTYAFEDISAIISHPGYGQFSMNGEGIGSFVVSKSTERTSHDKAADGHIMVSKIAGNNGNVVINAQQTSALHNWLQGLFNYLVSTSSDQWAQISLTIRSTKMSKTIQCSGGAFQKEPDEPFQDQGQNLSWTLMFADIQRLPLA